MESDSRNVIPFDIFHQWVCGCHLIKWNLFKWLFNPIITTSIKFFWKHCKHKISGINLFVPKYSNYFTELGCSSWAAVKWVFCHTFPTIYLNLLPATVWDCAVFTQIILFIFFSCESLWNSTGDDTKSEQRIVTHSAFLFLQTVTEWRKSSPLRYWGLYLPQARNWEFGSEPRAFKISNLTISGRVGFGSVIRIVPAHPHFPSHRLHFACAPLSLSLSLYLGPSRLCPSLFTLKHYSVPFHVAVVATETTLNSFPGSRATVISSRGWSCTITQQTHWCLKYNNKCFMNAGVLKNIPGVILL